MRSSPRPASLIALALLAAPLPAARADDPAGPPDPARPSLEERLARVRPASREAWQAIPWRADLGVARKEAEASGRPVFLWAMNGNPLGCT